MMNAAVRIERCCKCAWIRQIVSFRLFLLLLHQLLFLLNLEFQFLLLAFVQQSLFLALLLFSGFHIGLFARVIVAACLLEYGHSTDERQFLRRRRGRRWFLRWRRRCRRLCCRSLFAIFIVFGHAWLEFRRQADDWFLNATISWMRSGTRSSAIITSRTATTSVRTWAAAATATIASTTQTPIATCGSLATTFSVVTSIIFMSTRTTAVVVGILIRPLWTVVVFSTGLLWWLFFLSFGFTALESSLQLLKQQFLLLTDYWLRGIPLRYDQFVTAILCFAICTYCWWHRCNRFRTAFLNHRPFAANILIFFLGGRFLSRTAYLLFVCIAHRYTNRVRCVTQMSHFEWERWNCQQI